MKANFLMTYKCFTTPMELLLKMKERFLGAAKKPRDKQEQIVHYRVLNFLVLLVHRNVVMVSAHDTFNRLPGL